VVRVVLADDQLLDRKGLLALLGTQPDLRLVGEAASGEEAVELCRRHRPDVLVISVRMPGLDGISSISKVRVASPITRVLAIADRGEQRCLVLNPPRVLRHWDSGERRTPCPRVTDCLELAVAQGALGAIRRTSEPEELYRAVRQVAAGEPWYDSSTASRMVQQSMGLAPKEGAEPLSERELEVASLIAEGYANKDICTRLGITEPTVKKHVGRLLDKLGLDDRLQIGLYIARNPLVLERPEKP
jgi:DNA-binding NarL/FixJ family response regulator